MVKRLLLMLLGVSCLLSAAADISTAVTLQNYSVLGRLEDQSWQLMSGMGGSLEFSSLGNRNVKGELQVDAFVSDTILLEIPRAYLKVRFPALRVTAGKTAISWGEGFLFNAGDVIFDGMSLNANLADSVLRDNAITQVLITRYLGRVSFLDIVLLPTPTTYEPVPGMVLPTGVNLEELSAGGRLVLSILNSALEIGYLYKGELTTHNPYLTFSGGFFGLGDYFLNATCAIEQGNVDGDLIKDSFKASGGIASSHTLGNDYALSLRLEAGFFPFAAWEEETPVSVSPVLISPTYGMYLFPEVSFSPVDNLSLQLRSLISPVDGSGTVFWGANWNPYQGLTLGYMGSVMFGDEDDTYGWDRDNDLLFMFTVEYIFGN